MLCCSTPFRSVEIQIKVKSLNLDLLGGITDSVLVTSCETNICTACQRES